jgi:hypothetical protein
LSLFAGALATGASFGALFLLVSGLGVDAWLQETIGGTFLGIVSLMPTKANLLPHIWVGIIAGLVGSIGAFWEEKNLMSGGWMMLVAGILGLSFSGIYYLPGGVLLCLTGARAFAKSQQWI